MKLSKYTVAVPNQPDENHSILFSTLTRAIVQVPNSLYHYIKTGTYVSDRPDVQMLRQAGIVLDDNIDENLLYRFWSCRNRYRYSELSLVLIMGYACNCACKYCYEVGVRQGISGERMTNNVSDKILRWIKRYVQLYRTRRLDLCFHGGEPLLNLKQIERIGLELKRMCYEKEIGCFLNIVTNGTLLTPINVGRLVNAGVDSALITLDGPKPIHDERRPFLTGQGTFDIVLTHIKQAVDKLKIYVAMNVDRHNCESAEELADVLFENGLQEKLHGVLIVVVKPTQPLTEHCRLYDMPGYEFAIYNGSIHKVLVERGFRIRNMNPLGFCTMIADNVFVFDSYGDIYKCISGVGDEHFKIGNVEDDLNALAIKFSQFAENNPCNHNPDCRDCTFLPMCNGGCRHESYVRYGDMTKGTCLLDYYRSWVPWVIKELCTGVVSANAIGGKKRWIDIPS